MGITDSLKSKLPENKSGSRKGFSVREKFTGVNTAAGYVGKARPAPGASQSKHAEGHVSAPLTTLKDPASFGPPPRHVARSDVVPVVHKGTGTSAARAAEGLAANPNSLTLKTAPSGGLGAPLPVETLKVVEQYRRHDEDEEDEEEQQRQPPVPYRSNTTGIDPSTLPKPPRRIEPIQMEDNDTARAPATKPRPPPRLPPRQNSQPSEFAPSPPPAYHAAVQQPAQPTYLNKNALDRLGGAGVSVPGFDIGRTTFPPQSQTSAPPYAPPQQHGQSSSQLSELQSRFSKMPGRVSASSSSEPTAPTTGTTWAQKQAALTTAAKLNKDPTSISLAEVREAGSTANNFRQRHGEQVASGMQSAQGLDKKYGVSSRVGGWAQSQSKYEHAAPEPELAMPSPTPSTTSSQAPSFMGKKAPPPPPPKKKNLVGEPVGGIDAPPPIPMASRPRPP